MIVSFKVVKYDFCVLFQLIFFYYFNCSYRFMILDVIELVINDFSCDIENIVFKKCDIFFVCFENCFLNFG